MQGLSSRLEADWCAVHPQLHSRTHLKELPAVFFELRFVCRSSPTWELERHKKKGRDVSTARKLQQV